MKEAYHCLNYTIQHKHLPMRFTRDTYFCARTGTTVLRKNTGQGGRVAGVYTINREISNSQIDDGHSDSDYAAGPSVSGWASGASPVDPSSSGPRSSPTRCSAQHQRS